MINVTRRSLLIASTSFLAASEVWADATNETPGPDAAPFGLVWGMSTSEARAIGVSLDEQQEQRPNGAIFAASALPKVLADIRSVMLNFGYNDKLFRVWAASVPFEHDPSGIKVQERYNELLAVLAARYGKGDTHHVIGRLYADPDEFVMGLSTGRSFHYTDFKTKDLRVQIAVRGSGSSDSYYVLYYDFLPLSRQYEAEKKAREQKML